MTTLAGCAAMDVDMQKEQLAAAKICCQGPHEFRYKDLPPTDDLSLTLSDESRVFDFPSGRSYFDAVRIGRLDASSKLRIKIDQAGSNDPAYAQTVGIFCPSLSFLTAQHELIQTNYEPPEWNQAFWTSPFFFADYSVPPGAVYAVIHSEYSRWGERLSRVIPSRISGGLGLGGAVVGVIQLLSSGKAFTETQHIPCAPIAGAVRISRVSVETSISEARAVQRPRVVASPDALEVPAQDAAWRRQFTQLQTLRNPSLRGALERWLDVTDAAEISELRTFVSRLFSRPWNAAFAVGVDETGLLIWGGAHTFGSPESAQETAIHFCTTAGGKGCRAILTNHEFLKDELLQISKQLGAQPVNNVRQAFIASFRRPLSESQAGISSNTSRIPMGYTFVIRTLFP